MNLERLTQPPYETTLMGVVHGALAYYGAEVTPAKVYGGSGHAFVINVHDQLCPSSPYCWRIDGLYPLLENLGLRVRDLGFFHAESGREERADVEATIKAALDEGVACSLCNMDNQLIVGYDEEKLFTARPWPKNQEYPPGTLTFGDWREFGDEVHVNFFTLPRSEPKDDGSILMASLEYCVDLARNPEWHTEDPYGIGPKAYDNWLSALDEHGGSHGHWWNATVWSECRMMAAEYLREASSVLPDKAKELSSIAAEYETVGDCLGKAADREMPAGEKRALISEARASEAAAVDAIGALADALRK